MDSNKNIQGAGTTTGTDTYVVALSIGITQLITEGIYIIKFGNTNTGASTLNINSIGASPIKKNNGAALQANDIQEGKYHILIFDGTNFNIIDVIQGKKSIKIGNSFFDTLTDAKNAAISGDTIFVSEGTYNEKDLLKNGVNWHFYNGAIVNYTGAVDGAIFDDSVATGAGGAVTSVITGEGEFIRNGTGNAGSFKTVVYTDNTSTNLIIEGRLMDGNLTTIFQANGTLIARMIEFIDSTGDVPVFNETTGVLKVYCNSITADASNAVFSAGGDIYVECQDITSGTSTTISSTNSGVVEVHCSLIQNTGTGGAIFAGTGGMANIFATRITGASTGGVMVAVGGTSTSVLNVFNAEIENTSVTTGVTAGVGTGAASGDINFINCTIISNGTVETVVADGSVGTVRLRNSRIVNNGNNANSHGILKKGTGTLILDNVTIVTTNASADSVSATSAQDVIVYFAVANRDVNGDITELVNNIIVDVNVE